MARRGRCRCGFILTFHRGPDGYKTRCPECGCVVRLRLERMSSRRAVPRLEPPESSLPSPAASPVPDDSNSVPWPVPVPLDLPAVDEEDRAEPENIVPASAVPSPFSLPGAGAEARMGSAGWLQAAVCPRCGRTLANGATDCSFCNKDPSWPPHGTWADDDLEAAIDELPEVLPVVDERQIRFRPLWMGLAACAVLLVSSVIILVVLLWK